jgi:hypothetical protein
VVGRQAVSGRRGSGHDTPRKKFVMARLKSLDAESGEATITLSAEEILMLSQTSVNDRPISTYLRVDPA